MNGEHVLVSLTSVHYAFLMLIVLRLVAHAQLPCQSCDCPFPFLHICPHGASINCLCVNRARMLLEANIMKSCLLVRMYEPMHVCMNSCMMYACMQFYIFSHQLCMHILVQTICIYLLLFHSMHTPSLQGLVSNFSCCVIQHVHVKYVQHM
jgi:hypothetical protein